MVVCPKNLPYVLRVQCPVYVHKGVQLYLSLCSAGTYTKTRTFYLNDSLSQSFALAWSAASAISLIISLITSALNNGPAGVITAA
nr:hypothetical protein [Salmonella enterica subsp. enterica serovar Rissen]